MRESNQKPKTMENYKNLLEVIEKSNEEISYYLEDVSVLQFKKDVFLRSPLTTDKHFLSFLLQKLQGML